MDSPESNPEQSKSISDTAQSQSRPIGVDSKGNEEHKATTRHSHEDYPDDDIDKNLKAFWEWLKRERIPAHGWITALASIALLAVTAGQFVIGCENYRDNGPIVGFARDTTKAAQDFATSAQNINGGIGSAVGQLGDQATQTKNVADVNKEALTQVQRAFANPILESIPHFDQATRRPLMVDIHIKWVNEGNTPAIHWTMYNNFQTMVKPDIRKDIPEAPSGEKSQIYLFPKQPVFSEKLVLRISDLDYYAKNNLHVYAWGWGRYRDIFKDTKEHITRYCYDIAIQSTSNSDGGTVDWTAHPKLCSEGNCIDGDCKVQ
jgi:hypothetical protein